MALPLPIDLMTADDYADEAVRYYANARALLARVPIKNEGYTDRKPVREACGTAYLAVLAAVRSYLLSRGVSPARLPDEYKAYRQALGRHGAKNGKVMKAFHRAYHGLHIDGYYGGFTTVELVKRALENARFVIERLTARRIERP